MTRENVISKDDTPIGYTKFGAGPAVVVVHGGYSIQQNWFAFARELAATHTVYTYDRRGRGQSPDAGKPYTFDKELDDLAAMVALAGPGTSIAGHSFGGGVALAYAMRDGFTGNVILYEPMNSIFQQVSGGHLEEVKAFVDKGDLDAATYLIQTEIVCHPKADVDRLRKRPYWSVLSKYTPIFVREIEALDNLRPSVADADKLMAKTWLLLGEQSWPKIRIASAGLVSIIRGLTVYPIIGQHHLAYSENPTLLKDLVLRCLSEK
jgi:pimeloyl-ACP methyl ester carboxylesterase